MSVEFRNNINRTFELIQGLTENNANDGCLEVSMTALGARVDLEKVLKRHDIVDRQKLDIYSYLSLYGLKIVATASFDIYTTPEEVGEIIDNTKHLFTLSGVVPPKQMVKGVLMEILPMEVHDESVRGHAIAIIHRDVLPRDGRRMLQRRGQYLAVDTQQEWASMVIDDLSIADSINRLLDCGYFTTFYFLRKRRR